MDMANHRPGSLLAIGAKRGEKGSLTLNQDTTILTRPSQAGKRTSSKSTARRPAATLR